MVVEYVLSIFFRLKIPIKLQTPLPCVVTTGPIGSATPENLKRSHEGNLVPLFSKRL